MSCVQCLSRMAGFCSSATARNDVNMFLTTPSTPVYVSHARISLSRALMEMSKDNSQIFFKPCIIPTVVLDQTRTFIVAILTERQKRTQYFHKPVVMSFANFLQTCSITLHYPYSNFGPILHFYSRNFNRILDKNTTFSQT